MLPSERQHRARHPPRGRHCVNTEQTLPSRRRALRHRGVSDLSAVPPEFLGRQEFSSCTPFFGHCALRRRFPPPAPQGPPRKSLSLLLPSHPGGLEAPEGRQDRGGAADGHLPPDHRRQQPRRAVPSGPFLVGVQWELSGEPGSPVAHPESPETGVGGASTCRTLRPLRIRLTLPVSVGALSIYHPRTQCPAIISSSPTFLFSGC